MPGKTNMDRFVFLTKQTADEIKHRRAMHKAWCHGNGLKTPFSTHRGCECDPVRSKRIISD